MGFNVVFGGYMSIKRVAASVSSDIWIPATLEAARALAQATLRIFRDEGDRKDRQKARLMWVIEKVRGAGRGRVTRNRPPTRARNRPPPTPVLAIAHPHPCSQSHTHTRAAPSPPTRSCACTRTRDPPFYCSLALRTTVAHVAWQYGIDAWREKLLAEPALAGTRVEHEQPTPTTPYQRRDLLGVHRQPDGRFRVGLHVPSGRLSVAEAREIAEIADRYSGGHLRLTVEQNAMLVDVEEAALPALLAEPAVGPERRLSIDPGNIVGHTVSCTGSQFCGLAMIETKLPAERIARKLDELISVPRPLRIHWTGWCVLSPPDPTASPRTLTWRMLPSHQPTIGVSPGG